MSTRKLTLLDGGMGRELERSGAPFRQPEWSALALIESPAHVLQAHRAFIDAGAQVITTNSYAVVPFHIGEERFAASGQALASLAGRLAREAADQTEGVAVAGSLPPVGGSYRPDLVDADRSLEVLQELVGGLAAHVDFWLAETLSALSEAHAVKKALADDNKPLWLSFTLADGLESGAAPQLRSGERVEEAVAVALKLGASALLFNCSQPESMGAAIKEATRVLGENPQALRLGVYANAFPVVSAEAEANSTLLTIRADLGPAAYLQWAQQWVEQGASIVGGCCGIGPEHIAELASHLQDQTTAAVY
ncbi:homocysteine methyltransferase [Pseudomonas endophytica]|uniref:Homocysteine methyltransferase n=1 Tax=Pseudomonas endophytica TaxID=1563157 RepID=A0A0Q0X1Q4_9PSED|nr:homocysteine S-methyltransferase family protein [Pseudomonas endophytica]KQB53646.1 homocysteine methyltransferase [Pseudomonas endophytica]